VHVPLDEAHAFRWEPERVEAAITRRTKALVVNSPHNPTGSVLPRDDLQALVKVAEAHGLWVVSDEAYEHVVFDKRATSAPARSATPGSSASTRCPRATR
jgi:aspartate/methionine/tyrosine aminotransferase